MLPISILYQDEHLVAINKPAGLLVHRTKQDARNSQNALKLTRDAVGQYVYPVHRLDKPTSGVLLFALDKATANLLTKAFQARQVEKTYRAIVRGFTAASEVIDYPLKEVKDKLTEPLANTETPAQDAITAYQRLGTKELPFAVGRYPTARYSYLQLTPQTGRNRQIRRHLKHIFHPIIGDTKLGDRDHNRFFQSHFQCERLLLHAHTLSFQHPISSQLVDIKAPLDDMFLRMLEVIDFDLEEGKK